MKKITRLFLGSSLLIASTFSFGSNDFTITGWFRVNFSSSTYTLFSQWINTGTSTENFIIQTSTITSYISWATTIKTHVDAARVRTV